MIPKNFWKNSRNIATDVDNIDPIRHIYLPFMHIVKHFLGSVRPNLIISAMPKEAYTDNNVTCKCQTLLCFQELFLKSRAAAEGDDGVFGDHGVFS